jgi:plasmid stabilization system protein ParE
MSRFRISPSAARDIREITRYIARDNPARALTFAQELRATIAVVGERPMSFPERINRQRVRAALHHPYLILFRVSDDLVEVLRVVHGARDIDNLPEL